METIEIRPQPKQELFHASNADIAIFGGAAGPGKSWSLVYEPLKWVGLPQFTGVIFRRNRTQLVGGGSVWEESQSLYPMAGGIPRGGNILDWRFPAGARIEFNHLQHENDKLSHKSKQYCYIGFDECTDFTEGQFWYLLSRNRSMCGVRPYIRGATNPDPDSHIRKLIDWWIDKSGYPIPERSGVLRWFIRIKNDLHWADSEDALKSKFSYLPDDQLRPKSLTFIPALLDDNQILLEKDPDYRANLLAMHELDRLALMGGNWNVRPQSGDYFPRAKAQFVDHPPDDLIEACRGWDKAATAPSPANPDPDWTAGVKVGRARSGLYYVLDAVRDRKGPLDVEQMITGGAEQDGKRCKVGLWQDPAQAGKFDVAHLTRLLAGYVVNICPASKNKEAFAKPFSSQWLAGNVRIVRGQWNDAYVNEMDAFPCNDDNVKDDHVDASSVAFNTVAEGTSALSILQAMTRM
jgi:predicted phage terminase large subunit-like protein